MPYKFALQRNCVMAKRPLREANSEPPGGPAETRLLLGRGRRAGEGERPPQEPSGSHRVSAQRAADIEGQNQERQDLWAWYVGS